MIRTTTPRFHDPRRKPAAETPARDVAYLFGLIILAWVTTSCAGASVQQTCARAESWETFGSYEDCLALNADVSRVPAAAKDDAVQQRRAMLMERRVLLKDH